MPKGGIFHRALHFGCMWHTKIIRISIHFLITSLLVSIFCVLRNEWCRQSLMKNSVFRLWKLQLCVNFQLANFCHLGKSQLKVLGLHGNWFFVRFSISAWIEAKIEVDLYTIIFMIPLLIENNRVDNINHNIWRGLYADQLKLVWKSPVINMGQSTCLLGNWRFQVRF